MFKVNNKNNRTKCEICSKLTPMSSFSCLYCYLWTYFTLYSSVSIGNFEHVITAWVLELCKENTIEQDPENFVANIYVFKFTIRNTTKSCDICSKLTIKAVLLTSLCGVFIVDFEHILYLFLVFLLSTLNRCLLGWAENTVGPQLTKIMLP